MRSGKFEDLNADILQGHLSSALCHMGNISYNLGQDMTCADLKKRLAEVKSNENAAETFDRVTAHLTDNGVLVVNIGRAPNDRRLINDLGATILSVLPSAHVMDLPKKTIGIRLPQDAEKPKKKHVPVWMVAPQQFAVEPDEF